MSTDAPRIRWATDVHLNFVAPAERAAFACALADDAPEGVVLCGDIAEAPTVAAILEEIERAVACPIWFVLGNHDFYGGSVDAVRTRARRITRESARLRWLPACGVVELEGGWTLVGHDGWGDGRAGTPETSDVRLSDWHLIEDFAGRGPRQWLTLVRRFGDEAAAYLRGVLPAALARARRGVVVATHVPPFREACWHEGAVSDDAWAPWFTCVAVGEVLRAAAAAHPDRELLVLCGHTHGAGDVRILPNLRVITGGARYGAPAPQPPL